MSSCKEKMSILKLIHTTQQKSKEQFITEKETNI